MEGETRMGGLLVLLLQGPMREQEKQEEPLVEMEAFAMESRPLEEALSDKLELVVRVAVKLPSFE